MDALGGNLCEVEVDTCGQPLADAAPLLDLGCNRACYDVTRRELHLLRRIARHKALAVLVDEKRALGTARLGEEYAVDGESRRVELHHLGILERDACVHACNDAVACRTVWIGCAYPIRASVAARCNEHGLCGDADEVARAHIHRDHARKFSSVCHCDLKHLALGDEVHVMCKALLEERVHHCVPCAILEVGCACVGGAAHLALMEMTVLLTIVRIAHIVHLVDDLACILCEVFDGILIAEIVTALDRVKCM